MIKKYSAKSHVSISVVLGNGKSTHISFSPLTGGGSIYYTDDKRVQDAMEAHSKYGKLFKCSAIVDRKPEQDTIMAESIADKQGADKIEVSCLDDAKDYLSSKFGISRTKLRSEAAIKEAAKANNIEFVGI